MLLNKTLKYKSESIQEVLNRYSGFGADIFSKISEFYPELYSNLKYYRAIAVQTNDVFAVCENIANEFAIQLDPDIEIICIWDEKNSIEIGDWATDEYQEAMSFIEECFVK